MPILGRGAWRGWWNLLALKRSVPTYPGDEGLGVVTVLWAYEKFYKGQEPEGIHERGQWLLKIYVEATALLEKKENETPEETAQREAYDAERREMYRRMGCGRFICA